MPLARLSEYNKLCDMGFMEDADSDRVRVLIMAGAKVNARSKDGYTPLRLAAVYNPNLEVAQALLEAGAKQIAF